MFNWLFEGRTSVFVVLAASAILLLYLWWQTRKRWCLLVVVLAAALAGVYALLDRAIETDREQIVRKVHELAAAANARDLEGLFRNISESFRSPSGKNKQQLRDELGRYFNLGMVSNVRVWDIDCPQAPSPERSPVRVFFRAKAESGRELLADCDAVFDYDPQQGWRLKSIRLLKPQMTEEWQIQL